MTLAAPHRILIRATNWLGDVVMISPAIALVRQAFPAAHIALLSKRHLAGLYEGHRDLDEILSYDPKAEHRGIAGRWRLARELRAKTFDWAVILPKGFEAAVAPALARIPVRAGWATDRRGFLLTHKIAETPADFFRHHSDYFAQPLRLLGLTGPLPPPYFPLSENQRARGRELLAKIPQPVVVMHCAASIAPRQWAPDRFAAVANALRAQGAGIALIGSPVEQAQVAAIAAQIRGALNLAGATSLQEMAGVIAAADLFIGNDSGPMHLAGALGVKVLALFGAGHPDKTAPRGPAQDRVVVLHAGLACSPCKQRFWKECDPLPSGRPACLEALQLTRVSAAAIKLLAAG